MQEENLKYYLNLIDKSLDGELSKTQEIELKSDLENNDTLKILVKEHLLARANIRVAGEIELREKFHNKFSPLKETEIPESVNIQSSISYYLFAFVLIALILSAMYFLNRNNNVDKSVLIASNIASIEDPSYDLFRSADSTSMSMVWDKAVEYFADHDYKATLVTLKGLSTDSTFLSRHSGKLFLIKGVSFMKLEQYEDSEMELLNISTDNPYYDQAEWYLALNYFYSGQKEKAQKRLSSIKNNAEHYKRMKADEYLESLKKK